MGVQVIGKTLIALGMLIAGVGLLLMFSDKIPFIGKLQGDINIRRDNFQLFVPVTSSIIVSVVLSLILWLFSQFKGK